MSIEVLPLGYKCNIACTYCYQEPIRLAGNSHDTAPYDMAAMKAALLREGYRFTIFGGEPLMVPLSDLEELWRFGLEQFSQTRDDGGHVNSVQTNGSLVTEAHLAAFKRWDVGVGFSIDGPGALNDARWAGSTERTRAATAVSVGALERMLDDGQRPSLIVTLTRANAAPERLPTLVAWLRDLTARGLRNVNLHFLEVDNAKTRTELTLTSPEVVAAMLAIGKLQPVLSVAPLMDMVRLLRGEDRWNPDAQGVMRAGVTCTWGGCDPYTTAAVHGVDGQGRRHNCGRTAKTGVPYEKAPTVGYERYVSLYYTPQAHGGCQGCRFFSMCKGHCPGEGPTHDWREKTEHCATLMRLFEVLEAELVQMGEVPLSLSPDRDRVERGMVAGWIRGERLSLVELRTSVAASAAAGVPDGHGDHTDVERPIITHGDHEDARGEVPWARL